MSQDSALDGCAEGNGKKTNRKVGEVKIKRGLYRRIGKKICIGCDHPTYAPSKKINPENACKRCFKKKTKRERSVKWDG